MVNRTLQFLHELSLGRPLCVVTAAWLLAALAAFGMQNLRLRTDGGALVPTNHPAVVEDRHNRDLFGLKDPVVIILPAPDGGTVFQSDMLHRVFDWTRRLEQLPGVLPGYVFSLATESIDRVKPGTLQFLKLLDPVPDSPQAVNEVAEYLRALRLFHGTLIAEDESATAIMVAVPAGVDRAAFVQSIRTALAESGPLPEGVSFIGAPVAESLLGSHLLEDLGLPSWAIGRQGALAPDESTRGDPASFRLPGGLVPLAMLVIGTVILLCFQSPLACLLPMVKVGAVLAVVLGLMGWIGAPVYLPTAVMPVILTVAAITEEVHLLGRYRMILTTQPVESRLDTLRGMLPAVHVPMLKTALTTAVGFLSFLAAPIEPVRNFGLWTAVGILVSMSYALLVTPACFALISPRWLFPFRRRDCASGESRRAHSPWAAVGRSLVRRRVLITGIAMLVVMATPLGIARVTVQDSWIDGFAPESRFARAANSFNEHFLGMHLLHVILESSGEAKQFPVESSTLVGAEWRLPLGACNELEHLVGSRVGLSCSGKGAADSPQASGVQSTEVLAAERLDDVCLVRLRQSIGTPLTAGCPPGSNWVATLTPRPLLNHRKLVQIDALEEHLRTRADLAVGGVLGPATFLKATSFLVNSRKEDARRLPERSDRVEWLWNQYASTRGVERRRQVIDDDFRRAVVTVYLKNANFQDTARLIAEVRRYEAEHLKPLGLTVSFAGDVAVSQGMISAVVATPIRSVVVSLIGILLVATLMGRSLRVGILCALPSTLAVLVMFAFMGWLSIPLGVATSMFAAMTLGIGDDFAIHLVEEARAALSRGVTRAEATAEAVAAVGGTLVIDAAALALGFGVLLLSQVPANARLGLLLVLSLVVCLVASLVVLPALLSLLLPREKQFLAGA